MQSPRYINALGNKFHANTAIRNFHEFSLFTGITRTVQNQAFARSGLQEITLPNSMRSIGYQAFMSTDLSVLNVNEGCEVFDDQWVWSTPLPVLTFPSTTIQIASSGIFTNNQVTVVCLATTPPALGELASWNLPKLIAVYVPDDSVNAYKSASVWSSIASKILPLSELNQ